MFVSKIMICEMLESNFLDDDVLFEALNSLGYIIKSKKNYENLNDALDVCHVGSSRKTDDDDYMVLIDTGDDLPEVCLSDKPIIDLSFAIVAKNGKKIATKKQVERIFRGELRTYGHLCSLKDIGFEAIDISKKEMNEIYNVSSDIDLHKEFNKNSILNIIGFNDTIFDLDTNDSFYEIISNLAFYLKKNPVRKQKDALNNYEFDNNKKININSNCITSVATQIINVRKIFEITETKWELFSRDFLMFKKLNLWCKKQIFESISSIVEYETNARVIFFDANKINEELDLKYIDNELIISYKNKLIFTNYGYVDQNYIPTKSTKNILAIYLFKKNMVTNDTLASNRVGYWMNKYLISRNSTSISFIQEYKMKINNLIFNMSQINEDFESDKKIRIRQITRLLRFFDVDIKEYEEHSGTIIYTNLNGKINSLNDVIQLIKNKLKFNKI